MGRNFENVVSPVLTKQRNIRSSVITVAMAIRREELGHRHFYGNLAWGALSSPFLWKSSVRSSDNAVSMARWLEDL